MNKKAKATANIKKDKFVRISPQDVEIASQVGAKLFPGLDVPEVIRLVVRQRAESLGIRVGQ